ncbi:MAG: hypothetical protein ABIO70_24330, partial [Pseudomonadota bacterium]
RLAGLQAALSDAIAARQVAREALGAALRTARDAIRHATTEQEDLRRRLAEATERLAALHGAAKVENVALAELAPRLESHQEALRAAPICIAEHDRRRAALAARLAEAGSEHDLQRELAAAAVCALEDARAALTAAEKAASERRDERAFMRVAFDAARELVEGATGELGAHEQVMVDALARQRHQAAALRSQRDELALGVRALQERTAALGADRAAVARHLEELRAHGARLAPPLARFETVVDYNARGLQEARDQIAREAARRQAKVTALEQAAAALPGLEEQLAAARLAVPAAREAVSAIEDEEIESDERVARREGRVRRFRRLIGQQQAALDALLRERAERFPELALAAAARAERRRALEETRARRDAHEARRRELRAQLDPRYARIQELRIAGGKLARRFPEIGRAVAVQRRKIADLRARLSPGQAQGPDPLLAAADQARARATRVHARWRAHCDQLGVRAQQIEQAAVRADEVLDAAQERARLARSALEQAQAHLTRLRALEGLTSSSDSSAIPKPPPAPHTAPPPPPRLPPRAEPQRERAPEEYVFVPFREQPTPPASQTDGPHRPARTRDDGPPRK